MPRVAFAGILQRRLALTPAAVSGASVGAALAEVYAQNPRLRGYLLDDQGAVRKHVVIYVNGQPITDRAGQSDSVGERDEIFVFQALSGG